MPVRRVAEGPRATVGGRCVQGRSFVGGRLYGRASGVPMRARKCTKSRGIPARLRSSSLRPWLAPGKSSRTWCTSLHARGSQRRTCRTVESDSGRGAHAVLARSTLALGLGSRTRAGGTAESAAILELVGDSDSYSPATVRGGRHLHPGALSSRPGVRAGGHRGAPISVGLTRAVLAPTAPSSTMRSYFRSTSGGVFPCGTPRVGCRMGCRAVRILILSKLKK